MSPIKQKARLPFLIWIFGAILLFCIFPIAQCLAHLPAPSEVDKIFSHWNRTTSPGCSIGVMSKGAFVYQHGYGMANLDFDIQNSVHTEFYVASMGKQFTAMSIALLAHKGKLSFDDNI